MGDFGNFFAASACGGIACCRKIRLADWSVKRLFLPILPNTSQYFPILPNTSQCFPSLSGKHTWSDWSDGSDGSDGADGADGADGGID